MVLFFAWFFYRSVFAALPLSLLYIPYRRYRLRERRTAAARRLRTEFREAVNSMLTALRAGFSPENAVRESLKEMRFLFGDGSPVVREFTVITKGLDNGIPLEELMAGFGARSGSEDIREFADTFAIARRGSGGLTDILTRTMLVLTERMNTEEEIRVLLASRQLELRIMSFAPFLITGYISVTTPGFFEPLFGSAAGMAAMTGCLALYLAAYLLSRRILDIEI